MALMRRALSRSSSKNERGHRTDVAAREAGEREGADVDDVEGLEFLVEVAPEAERRDVADAHDAVEVAAREHALAGGDERKIRIFAKTGKRLGVDGGLEAERVILCAGAVVRSEAAEDHDGTSGAPH